MKAVVLVGGEGTRLRPLTETIPKPLIPLVDRPFLDRVLDHLAAHGVEEVLLSSPYLGERFEAFISRRASPPRVTWIAEATPLGTGGAIANAARALDESFFVLNGDILTDLDLRALLEFHRANSATATIAVAEVEDARPYGLVALGSTGRIDEFREKPAERRRGVVNTGTYVLEPEAIAAVPAGNSVSVEREVFPALIEADRPVFGFLSPAYWIDLGTPEKYLRATFDLLEGRVGGEAFPTPFVASSAAVSLRAHLGSWVVVHEGARVGDDAEVEDSVLLAGAEVGEAARVRDSILGPRAIVGAGALVAGAVLAERATVPPGTVSEGARISAGQVLSR
ncbi:MAG: sugar phosphate nucleotidyltransferase [Actinomycetota bacterium]